MKHLLRIGLFAVCVVVNAAPVVAQAPQAARRTFTADDLFSLEQIGDVVPSPDGALVAYVHKRPPRTASGYKRDFMGGGDYADIWIAPATGGAPRNITNGASDGSGYFAPVWSPDGKRLALLSTKTGNVYLWVWDRASGRLRQLIADRAASAISGTGIVWTDNTNVLTTVLPPNQSPKSWSIERLPAIVSMDAWPKAWKGQETTASVLDAGGGEPLVTSGVRELRLVDVDRATSKVLSTGDVGVFSLSPDRRRIAIARRVATYQPSGDGRFSNALSRDRYEIGVITADGSPVWSKVEGVGALRAGLGPPQLQWSDDGSRLAVFAWAPKSKSQDDRLYRINVDARSVEDMTPANVDMNGSSAMWASANRLLLFAKAIDADPKKTRTDWWLVESATNARNLTASMTAAPSRLVRTSDDKLIGVASNSVWNVALDGSAPRNLTSGSTTKYTAIGWPTDPAVKPAAIIVSSTRDSVEDFHRLDAASGQLTTIQRPTSTSRIAAARPDVSATYFITEENAGTSLDVVRGASDPPATIVSLNAFLRDITPATTRRFDYRTSDGQDVKGWLLLPPGFETGKKYPMVLWVYAGTVMGERPPRSAGLNQFSAFNMNVAAAHGYVVLFPSMPLKPDPETANWAASDPFFDLPKGVLPAIDKVIDMGIADPKRIGVMGQSYGGYSTMSLIAQTDRFAAAVELAGPPNLVSLYGQFETREAMSDDRMEGTSRDGYYLHWSEAGQGRMGVPPWKDMQRYIRNSPITYADRINTPLMLVQGDMDIIGLQQGEEMFTALYRQNKRARFVRYWGEGHVLNSPANIKDFWSRTFDWFDQYFNTSAEKKANDTMK